jgi:uncharacterized membrane protein
MQETRVRQVFETSLVLKGVNAFVECLGGAALFFTSAAHIRALVGLLTQHELREDPQDAVSNFLLHAAQQLPVSTQQFYAFYLLSHGLVKLFLVVCLLQNRLWAYPVSIFVMGLFILYQVYRFSMAPGLLLATLSVFDLFVIGLIWREYKVRRPLP